MIACQKRHVHIVSMLTDNGAQVNLQTQVLQCVVKTGT